MKHVVWIAVVVLGIVHQDFWWWADKRLVFGFLPVGLAYHALFSVAAAVVWAGAVRWAWPSHIEQWADQPVNATAPTEVPAR